MSQLSREELIRAASDLLTAITGEVDPSDEEVLEAYLRLHEKFYSAQSGAERLTKTQREDLKARRRGIEMLYPWVRQNQKVKSVQARRYNIKRIDVIPDNQLDGGGLVILHGAKSSGGPEMIRYGSIYPQFEGVVKDDIGGTGADPAPLHVLLTNLLHMEAVVDENTPVFLYRYDTRSRKGQHVALAPPLESAIPLSLFLADL